MSKKRQPKPSSPKPTVPPARQKPRPATNFWRAQWLPTLLLFVLPFVLYQASLKFGYVLDDKIVLSENQFVKKGVGGIADIFSTESFTGFLGQQQDLVAGARYRPLSIATFALEQEAYGSKPGRSHFWNIFLYALTGLMLFRLFWLFGLGSNKRAWYLGIPLWAAALFLLHPIHTEVVANIKGRDEILALLLALATLYGSIRYHKSQRLWWLPISGALFFLALLAKENALTFLAVIPISLFVFNQASIRKAALAAAPLLLAFLVYLAIRVNVIGYLLDSGKAVTGIMNDPFVGASLAEKYATISYTLGYYLRLLVFPHPLTHDYYPYQIPIINWADWRAWSSLLLYVALAFFAVRHFRRKGVVSWSIWYYLITLSIVSNVVFSVGAPMNERFLYMPSVGFCLVLAYFTLAKLSGWVAPYLPGSNWPVLALLGLIGLGYGAKTINRVPDWKDEMALNRAAIKVSTNSARANSYMAYSLYQAGLAEQDTGRKKALFEEALPYVNKALEIYPEYTDAITCKGGLVAGLYQLDGNLEKLLDEFYQLLQHGHVSFLDQYLAYLNSRADPQMLADFYYRAGFELLAQQKKNYPLAIQYLNYGLSVQPSGQRLLEGMAVVRFESGDYAQALQVAQQGLQLYPNSAVLQEYQQKAGEQLQR